MIESLNKVFSQRINLESTLTNLEEMTLQRMIENKMDDSYSV
jgi:hypothetical protein